MAKCSTAVVLFVCTIICAWGAFGLGVTAVGGKTWLYKSSVNSGLWLTCISTDVCTSISASAALNAVRSFVIIGIVFGFVGITTFQSGYWKWSSSVGKAGYGLILFAALCWTVAMVTYTVTYSGNVDAWGLHFAFGWGCVGLLNLAGCFGAMGVSKRGQDSIA